MLFFMSYNHVMVIDLQREAYKHVILLIRD